MTPLSQDISTADPSSRRTGLRSRTSRSAGGRPSQIPPFPPSFHEMSRRQRRAFGSLMAGSSASCDMGLITESTRDGATQRFLKVRQNSYRRLLLKSLGMTPLPWYRPLPKGVYRRMRRQWLQCGNQQWGSSVKPSTSGKVPRVLSPLSTPPQQCLPPVTPPRHSLQP